jgi:hypothetical protein
MAFSNVAKPLAGSGDAPTASDLLYKVERARVPLRNHPFTQATAATESPAYAMDGRDTISVILYGTPGQAAPTGFVVQLYGSHSNAAGSYVKVGADITALGETVVAGHPYAYVVLHLDSISAGALEADLCIYRAG